MRSALVAVMLAGCGTSQPVLAPVVDVPTNDSASAFPVDQLTMAVAHDGSTVDIVSTTFTHGQTVSLSGVPFADDLVVHLTGFVGTQPTSYGRTCAFVIASGAPLPQPHLFFSRSVKFAGLTAMPEVRQYGLAITYHDGSALLLGGYASDPNNPSSDVERFDPMTGQLEVTTDTGRGDVLTPRLYSVAATLGVGTDAQVVVIGGVDSATSAGAQYLELVVANNPQGRRIQQMPNSQMGRVGLTATSLSDGSVIAIGGHDPTMAMPAGDVDQVVAQNGVAVVTQLRATLAHPRTGHTATRLSDDVGAAVLVAGGVDGTATPVGPAELFKPLSQSFSPTFTASMVVPRTRHTAVRMPDGSVLILGGVDKSGNPVTELELFTQDAGFAPILDPNGMPAKLPANAGVVDLTATTLPDGRVLIAGGRTSPLGPPVPYAFIARLDPLGNPPIDIIPTDKLAVPRAGHQATLMCDGTVLLSGGTADQQPIERYNPPPDGRR